jgi:hypothetical protein
MRGGGSTSSRIKVFLIFFFGINLFIKPLDSSVLILFFDRAFLIVL